MHTPDADPDTMRDKYENESSEYVTMANGDRIHYRDEGNPTGTPLLLIHGSSSSLQTWEPLVERLGDRYRLISYDQPGHGLTGPNQNRTYTAGALHKAAISVLDHLDIERAIWVGNSMGGWLSWRAGIEHSDRVSGLVLISASGAPLDEPRELYLAAKIMQTELGRWLAPRFTPRSIARSSAEHSYYDDALVTDELVDRYWELARFPGNRVATVDRARVDREPEYWDRVSDIDVPVLVLWGDQDTVTPTSMATKYKEQIPNTEVIIYPNVAHIAMEEVPDKVARDIDRWVQSAR